MTKLFLAWDPVVKDPGHVTVPGSGVSFEESGSVWSVVLRSHGESSRDLGVSDNSEHKVARYWRQVEGTCDPGQAGFSASLMLSQVLHDWIETEVVFHSPEVLRLCGESSRDLGGVCRLRAQVTLSK